MARFGGVIRVGTAVGVAVAFVWLAGGRAGVVEAKDLTAVLATGQSGLGKSAPTIQVYSRETVVDVTVTDKDGKPVHGLTREDFSITEDGKPQPTRGFEEIDGAPRAASPMPRRLPPNTYTNVQTASGPLYVVLDGGKWGPQFVRNLPPGTRYALIAGGSRLTILQGSNEPGLRPGKVIGVNPIKIPIGAGCVKQISVDWFTLNELNELATYLSGIPGKKNLIWVGRAMSDLVWDGCQVWNGPLQQTYDLLEDAQITVYPVDPVGVQVPDTTPPSGPTIGQTRNVDTSQALKAETSWLSDSRVEQLAMEAVAEATGGSAFYNTNDIAGAIASAAEAGSSYYTLSYIPPSVEYDGRYHAISIKVKRPDVHLLYRKGYSAEDPALIEHRPETLFGIETRDTRPVPTADPLVAAMAPIAPPATQLIFDVRVERSTDPVKLVDPAVMGILDPKLKDRPLTRYSFSYSIDAGQFTFSAVPGNVHKGMVMLDVAAYDAGGNLVTSLSQTVTMPMSDAKYQQFIQGPFQFLQQIDLPPGRMCVRVGVRDAVSNKVGTVEIPVMVAKGTTVAGR